MKSKMKKIVFNSRFLAMVQFAQARLCPIGLTKTFAFLAVVFSPRHSSNKFDSALGLTKTSIYSVLLAASLGVLVSCDQDDEYRAAEPALYLTASTRIFALPADGGQRTVVIDTNCADWKVSTDAAGWLSTKKEGDLLTVTAMETLTSKDQTAIVTVASTDDPSLKCEIRVMQYGFGARNLSAEGTANCYMARTGTSYLFDASVKGNGGGDGMSKYIDKHGLSLDKGVVAELLWEAVFDADKTRSRGVIDGVPVYNNGRIWFTTGKEQGNAVIALRDFTGEIVWSWHIWVTDDEVTLKPANGFEWMDRNLGALNNTPGDLNNRGMFYQWGRKDPFLPSSAPYMADNLAEANVENHQVGDGTAAWAYTGVRQLLLTEAPGNIENAVRHPTQFLKTYYQYSGSSWYVTPTNDALKEADLWGGNKVSSGYKTIFDPCPAGYMVPPDGAFVTAAGDMTTGVNMDAQWGPFENNGREWIGGTGDFFPSAGILTINTPLTNCGHIGIYWTASANTSNGYGYEVYVTSGWARYREGATAYGNSVRCVKEK